jgi:hypothetical protein
MLRFSWLARATFLGFGLVLAGAPAPAVDSAPPPASTASVMTPDLVGLSRADVVAVLGRPTAEREAGDVMIMLYANGVRVELRQDAVVAVRGSSSTGEIIGADGARYVPGADGRVRRVDSPVPADAAALPEPDQAAGGGTTGLPMDTVDIEEDEGFSTGAEEGPVGGALMKELEEHVEAMENPQAEEPVSATKQVLIFALGVVFRFGFTLLVLRIAVHVVEIPFFWPDLTKVAGLCLAVHAFMEGLAELGGLWEFITLFALDDIVTFIILACSLTWFKVAGSGLTALKIAAATQFVVIGLMFAVGLAVAFGLSPMQ